MFSSSGVEHEGARPKAEQGSGPMGLIRGGPPEKLVEELRSRFGLTTFIETGTYEGATTEWAAARFERVVTIELADALHGAAAQRLQRLPNVEAKHGDSRSVLAELVPTLDGPALFWLDAHWSGGQTAGSDNPCALSGELAALRQSPHRHYVLIDDARLFLSPPPLPHPPDAWPRMRDVEAALRELGVGPSRVVEDVIVAVPPGAARVVRAYARRVEPLRIRARRAAGRARTRLRG
jgi:hypothetical protein